jgi:hypothetical protein
MGTLGEIWARAGSYSTLGQPMEKRMIATDYRLINEDKVVLKIWPSGENVWIECEESCFSMKLTDEEVRELIHCLERSIEQ